MTIKPVEFKKYLTDYNSLRVNAVLESNLFDTELISEENKSGWVGGIENILSILQRNYKNPKAMNCFIFYDIKKNKLRVQIAKYLLQKGAQRIQKSVYLANISKKIYEEIIDTFQHLDVVLEESDSILMVPIGEYHLAEMKILGKDVDMSFSRSNQNVIYI